MKPQCILHFLLCVMVAAGLALFPLPLSAEESSDGKGTSPNTSDALNDYMRVDTLLIREIIDNKISRWLQHPIFIKALTEQNSRYAGISSSEIDNMDRQWVVESNKRDHPFIDLILENESSQALRDMLVESKGLYTEVLLIDKRGLIVGTTNVTSDYWQGDEDKWRKTFLMGAQAVHISEVYYDDSAQAFQVMVSLTISVKNVPIGVLSVGIDIEEIR